MVLANQNAKLTGPDQGFLVSRLVLTLKPWERGWHACSIIFFTAVNTEIYLALNN
jgi:hypothetical protein